MTNVQIIMMEQERLFEEGILHLDENEDIQPIHTYAGWKTLGFQVKRGAKAVAKFPVWKFYAKSKKQDEIDEESVDDEVVNKGRMFMKVAAFFTDEQVERIQK